MCGHWERVWVRADFVLEAGSVMPDFEAAKGGGIGRRRFAVLLNMSAQLALEDGFEKGAHFLLVADGLELDAAVAEIAHGTGHVKTLRDVPYRPAKTHALDVAFVKDLNGCRHASEDCCGFAPAATARCRFIAPVREREARPAADLPAVGPGADRSSSD